jgi:hypothetical protein
MSRVTAERVRALFGNPGPYHGPVWEEQFDDSQDGLALLAQTPWDQLRHESFWEFFHDLRCVKLQPEIFNYLFPASLVMAQERLMAGLSAPDAGDSDFFNSLSSDNWKTVCTERQIEGIYEILADGLLDRIDAIDSWCNFVPTPAGSPDDETAFQGNWLTRLNTYGIVLPSIEPIWTEWWSLSNRGRALAALQYIWGIAGPSEAEYAPGDLDWFAGGVYFQTDALVFKEGWHHANLELLRNALTYDWLLEKSQEAAAMVGDALGNEVRGRIVKRLATHRDLIERRLNELFTDLGTVSGLTWKDGWSCDL